MQKEPWNKFQDSLRPPSSHSLTVTLYHIQKSCQVFHLHNLISILLCVIEIYS